MFQKVLTRLIITDVVVFLTVPGSTAATLELASLHVRPVPVLPDNQRKCVGVHADGHCSGQVQGYLLPT